MFRSLFALLVPFVLIAGCVPESGPADGVVDEHLRPLVTAEFVWPPTMRGQGGELVFEATDVLPLNVRLFNPGNMVVDVRLDDLVMRTLPEPVDSDGPPVEAVFTSPGTITLLPGELRVLEFGEMWLFFGFRCDVVLGGEVSRADGARPPEAFSLVSPPIVVEL